MKDAALRDIDPATVFLFAEQGGKFVFTNHQNTTVTPASSR